MKSKILLIVTTLVLVSSLFITALPAKPASAGTLSWSTESLPSAVSVNFVDYAVSSDGNTIYGVVGNNVLFKSTNGGASWSTRTITGAPGFELVAVAPDDANIVALADSTAGTNPVWISTNGAVTGGADSWNNAGTVGNLEIGATDLAISPAVSGVWQIAISGTRTGPLPAIFSLNLGGTVASWTDIAAQSTGVIGAASTTKIFAIKFSPNFVSDRLLVAVSNDSAAGNYMNLFRFNTTISGAWNAAAGFMDYTGATTNASMINSNTGTIVSAAISLAPNYLGSDSISRNAFVAIDSGAPAPLSMTSGVYQMKDSVSKLISDSVRMTSVAFNGTTLVAGRTDSNLTYRSSDPLADTPILTATTQFQRPSGGMGAVSTNTLVAWAGANVVAATQGNESAFSRSTDNGTTYQDISMYNTAANAVVLDLAVSADGSKLYMATTGNATGDPDVNVWSRTGSTWTRLMSIINPAPKNFSLRIAPENSNVLYLVQVGTQNLYYTDDGGDKNWTIRIANENIVDLAVESSQVVYYATGLNVRKSTNGGFLWNDPAVASLSSGSPFSLRSLGIGLLIETANNGVVSYSTNGGTSWTRPGMIAGAGSLQATAGNMSSGNYIYAAPSVGNVLSAVDNVIYRYKIGSVYPDNVWTKISPATSTTSTFSGLVLKGGILYAATTDVGVDGIANTVDDVGNLYRSINPADALTSVIFSTIVTTPDIKISGGRTSNLQVSTASSANSLWVIDSDSVGSEEPGDSSLTVNDEVYSFTDTLATSGPTLISPVTAAEIAVNTITGRAYDVAFSWSALSLSTNYTLEIALDSAFTQKIFTYSIAGSLNPVTVIVGPYQPGDRYLEFMPETTYYWRVKATAPLESPYSTTRSFTIASLVTFALVSPVNGAANIPVKPLLTWLPYKGAKWYEVSVSMDPSFAIPEWSHNAGGLVFGVVDTLKYNTTYYWRVRGVTADPFVQGTAIITPAGPYASGAFITEPEPTTPVVTGVVVSVNAPAWVPQNYDFNVPIAVNQIENFDAAGYTVSFDPVVFSVDNVTDGRIGSDGNFTTIPVDMWSQNVTGTVNIVQNIAGLTGVNGTGSLAVLHFHTLGSMGQNSDISLAQGALSSTGATDIPATWLDDFIEISLIPADSNHDSIINAIDITKMERIIAHLDEPTAGADANQDSSINALDITKVERIIVGLDIQATGTILVKYGGTLNTAITTSPTNFDSGVNSSGGALLGTVYEQYMGSDWRRGPAGSGVTNFAVGANSIEDNYGPQLSSNWTMPSPGVWILQIRQGVHWALNPSSEASRLVNGRTLTVDDIVYSLRRLLTSSTSWIRTAQPAIASNTTIVQTGPWQVTINTPVDYMTSFTWIIQGAGFNRVYPPEVVAKYGDMNNWRNAVGTGPYMLAEYIPGAVLNYVRNPNYWDTNPLAPGLNNKLPYISNYREIIIPDASTRFAALRTGKIDLMSGISSTDKASLIQTIPQLQTQPYLSNNPWAVTMRTDLPPFNDVRVRQAMMLATDFNSIKRDYYGGTAEIDVWPVNNQLTAMYLPLSAMPQAVQDLYTYNPERAKQLLKDAGYPSGFNIAVVINNVQPSIDEMSIIKDMWAKVGIGMTLDFKTTSAYNTVVSSRSNTGMLYRTTYGTFMQQLGFVPERGTQSSNPSYVNDPPGSDAFIEGLFNNVNSNIFVNMPAAYQQYQLLKPYLLERAYQITMPTPYTYNVWWPWLKNYYGQGTGFIRYAWIDQDLKATMGY